MSSRQALGAGAAAVAVAGGVAAAGSHGGVAAGGVPVFALCVALAFAMQWAAFVPAWYWRTERWFDLVGSATFLTVMLAALAASGWADARALLLAAMVAAWALRLGAFLFARIRRQGFDRRFAEIKRDAARFLPHVDAAGAVGVADPGVRAGRGDRSGARARWVGPPPSAPPCGGRGSAWRSWPTRRSAASERGRRTPTGSIATGLWARCRHPNYFGEIVLWTGVAVAALPALESWRYVTLISPVFVWLLLTRISGIPLLEAQAERQWGGDPAYLSYRARTPTLVPALRRRPVEDER